MSSTLYELLGGETGITQIVEDAVNAHLNNPVIQSRFQHGANIERAKKMSVEFFCAGSGGPQSYSGRDMVSAHQGMNISEQEFMAVVDDVLEALDKNAIGAEARQQVLSILYGLKGQIIRI